MEMKNEGRRSSEISRETNETKVYVRLDVDGQGRFEVQTGNGFFDHMLEQLSQHSGFDLTVRAEGDSRVDCHHMVEDVALVLGQALGECIRDKKGIERFGEALIPMEEALCQTAVDLCGRAKLVYQCGFSNPRVGDMDTEMFEHFFSTLVSQGFITLHIRLLYGTNTHHMAESMFKATAVALKRAVRRTAAAAGIPSTKGCL